MKISDEAIRRFSDIFAREYDVVLSREEAEAMIGNLVTLYRGLYEWHYHSRRREHQIGDEAP